MQRIVNIWLFFSFLQLLHTAQCELKKKSDRFSGKTAKDDFYETVSIAIVLDYSAASFLPKLSQNYIDELFRLKTIKEYSQSAQSSLDDYQNSVLNSLQLLKNKNINLSLFTFSQSTIRAIDGFINCRYEQTFQVFERSLKQNSDFKDQLEHLQNNLTNHRSLSKDGIDLLHSNWQNALKTVQQTCYNDFTKNTENDLKQSEFNYPDYILFIVNSNPTSRDDLASFSKSNISAAILQAEKFFVKNACDKTADCTNNNYIYSERKTSKLIVIGSENVKEEYLRAMTCLTNPQFQRDYFIFSQFNQLESILKEVFTKYICCKTKRDKCNNCPFNHEIFSVVQSDKSRIESSMLQIPTQNYSEYSCENNNLVVWSNVYLDKNFEIPYNEIAPVRDGAHLFVSLHSLDLCKLRIKQAQEQQKKEFFLKKMRDIQNHKYETIQDEQRKLEELFYLQDDSDDEDSKNSFKNNKELSFHEQRCSQQEKFDFAIERIDFCFSEKGIKCYNFFSPHYF